MVACFCVSPFAFYPKSSFMFLLLWGSVSLPRRGAWARGIRMPPHEAHHALRAVGRHHQLHRGLEQGELRLQPRGPPSSLIVVWLQEQDGGYLGGYLGGTVTPATRKARCQVDGPPACRGGCGCHGPDNQRHSGYNHYRQQRGVAKVARVTGREASQERTPR